MKLIEWASSYIDYLNSFKRDLISKQVIAPTIICEYKEKGKLVYIITEELDESVYGKIKDGQIVLVCLNSKKNIDFMLLNWQNFIINPKLKTIFSNPEANLQWSLVPYTHNKYADPASLKTGIKSIAENVPLI